MIFIGYNFDVSGGCASAFTYVLIIRFLLLTGFSTNMLILTSIQSGFLTSCFDSNI